MSSQDADRPAEPRKPAGTSASASVPDQPASSKPVPSDPPTGSVPVAPARGPDAPVSKEAPAQKVAPAKSPETGPAKAPGVAATATPKSPPRPPAKAAPPVAPKSLARPLRRRSAPGGPPTARTGGAGGATLLATAALIVAIVAVLVALFAVGEAQDAKRQAEEARAGGQPATGAPTGAATTEPVSTTGAPGATATPTAFIPPAPILAYDRQLLQVLGASCFDTVFVDLDEPRVGPAERADVYVSNFGCSNASPPELYLTNGARAAVSTTGAVTPTECAGMVDRTTATPNAHMPVRVGLLLCIRTSEEVAFRQSVTPKVALIEVTDISPTNLVTMQVTAWNLAT